METLLTLTIAAPVVFYFVSRHWKEHKSKSAQTPRFAGRIPLAPSDSKVGPETQRHTG